MRCSDPCACPCEQQRLDVATNDLSLMVLPVVVKNPVARSIVTSTSSNPTLYPAVHSLESELSENVDIFNAAAWQVWDAPTPEGNGNQSMKPSPAKTPVIRDFHRPVDLSNGARQTGRSNAAILHNPSDISGQVEQKRSLSGSPQPLLTSQEGFVHQFNENPSLEPPISSPNSDTYATVAREPSHPPPPLALDVLYRIDDSTEVIGSAQTKTQTYNNGQSSNKSSSNSPSFFRSGRSYSGASPSTTNTEPVVTTQMATTMSPVSASPMRLFVSGIVEADSSASLKRLFTQFGTVLDAIVMNDAARVTSGYPKRFGFVTMASSRQADAAISRLHGRSRHGQALSVQIAKPHSNSSITSPNNLQKHPVPISKGKENNLGLEAPLKKSTPGLMTQSNELEHVLTEFNHSPNDDNVECAPSQSYGPSDNNGDSSITIVTGKQEVAQIQDDDLISFY